MGKKVLFVTGTRADYSKLKPLIEAAVDCKPELEPGVFITGMHLLADYGSTHMEISSFSDWDYRFINQNEGDTAPAILAKTISGLSDFMREISPDLIVVHGDRLEAMAAALVGAASNTLVAHVEGGEVSGTIDDSYRHAISKLSQIHLVSNERARQRLHSLGENPASTWAIGSPELDLMHSTDLPSIEEVRTRYAIPWERFAIAIIHPVATEAQLAGSQAEVFIGSLIESGLNYVVIESNNDLGSAPIRSRIRELNLNANFRILPSMRFEHFLTLLKNAEFIAGNSSAGVREAPHYGVPAINVGSRQNGRVSSKMVQNVEFNREAILEAISGVGFVERVPEHNFGDGRSAVRFKEILQSGVIWDTPLQKVFYEGTAK